MADILVRCPCTFAAVSTGVKAEWVKFDSLPAVEIPFSCTACGLIHRWKREDAWIGHASQAGQAPRPLINQEAARASSDKLVPASR